MKFVLQQSRKTFRIIICLAILSFACIYFLLVIDHNYAEVHYFGNSNQNESPNKQYPVAMIYERKDWHDWEFIEYEKSRQGPGEQGKPHVLTDPGDIELNEKLFPVEGLYAVISDKISVNRSVPDTRLPE